MTIFNIVIHRVIVESILFLLLMLIGLYISKFKKKWKGIKMKYFIDAMNKYDALMLIVILLAIFGLLSIIYIIIFIIINILYTLGEN